MSCYPVGELRAVSLLQECTAAMKLSLADETFCRMLPKLCRNRRRRNALASTTVAFSAVSTFLLAVCTNRERIGVEEVASSQPIRLPAGMVVLLAAFAPMLIVVGADKNDKRTTEVRLQVVCVVITIASYAASVRRVRWLRDADEDVWAAHAVTACAYVAMCVAFTLGTAQLICRKPPSPWSTLRLGATFAGLDFVVANSVIRFAMLPDDNGGRRFRYAPGRSEYASSVAAMLAIALLGVCATPGCRWRLTLWMGSAPYLSPADAEGAVHDELQRLVCSDGHSASSDTSRASEGSLEPHARAARPEAAAAVEVNIVEAAAALRASELGWAYDVCALDALAHGHGLVALFLEVRPDRARPGRRARERPQSERGWHAQLVHSVQSCASHLRGTARFCHCRAPVLAWSRPARPVPHRFLIASSSLPYRVLVACSSLAHRAARGASATPAGLRATRPLQPAPARRPHPRPPQAHLLLEPH